MSGEHREVPSDLITHNPKEHNAPIEATASGEVPLENMDNAPGANMNAPTQSIYTPNKTGLISAGVATPVAITGQKVVGAGNWIMDKFGKPSLQTYANSQIGDKNLNIPVKDLQKLTGLPVPVTNPALVQRASKIISGREAVPDTFKEIYTVDPVTGKQTLSHVEKTPGAPEVAPLDPNKLKPYEKNAKYYAKKHGELPLRTGVAAYNIGKGLSEENKLVGGAEVGAGVAMGAAPWLPKNVKGIPLRAIATGLGLIPGASEAIGSASAEPLDIPGMAIDYGMGLMAPSTLGDATLHKNPRYTPGMSVLHGSTLPPEMRAQGGLIHLAGGGQPELGTAQAYEPSYSEKIRDYAAKHIGREHANRLFGGANARVEDNFNPISMALQTPGMIADSAAGFVKAGQEGDYLGGMGNYLIGAMNVAPMLKPAGKFAKTLIPKMAGGKSVVAEGAVDLAKKASGYLHHTNINPNPLVGTRFETKDLGGLAPVKDMSLEDIRGHMIHSKPWDLTSRNQQIVSVSGKPITTDIVTHGGQPYVRDLEHMKQDIGGASAFPISNRIQKITNISSKEGEKLGGTGQVTMTPSTMSQFSEDYAIPTFDTYKNLWDQAEPGAARTQALLEKLKFASPKTLKTETPIPFAGMVKDVNYPFRDLKSLDFNDPDVAGRFMQTPDLRKALIKEWRSKENQKMMGYNAEDLSAAHTDPNLINIPPAYAGHTMIEMRPGAKPTLSSNITYDTDFAGKYLGSVGHTPTPVLLNKSYSKINDEMRQLHPDANEDALHRLTMGALYTRNHGVSDLVNDEMINRVGAYHEGVKQNKIDPNDVQGALQYLSKPGAYNEGGSVESFAPGGKVGAAKKLFDEAQAAYKAKFTPGFYHASPSNEIEAFDSLKSPKGPEKVTPGVTFAARNPDFANSLLPDTFDEATNTMVHPFTPGSTVYPININMSNHFNPKTKEGQAVMADFVKQKYLSGENPDKKAAAKFLIKISDPHSNWTTMEGTDFLEHLKNTGHKSFEVSESGFKNVGVFNPADIRGKFAKFNPEHAADPDFMKAAGGAVQHFQAGKRVLSGLSQIAKYAHGQNPKVAQALEEYLKGNISQEERIRVMNQFLPMRQWNELPPNYTDDQIRNALLSNKQSKALAPVPEGMQVGNRLDIPAYTQHGVYVDTTHDAAGKPISYNRTGHLTGVDFSSKPNQAVRVGLGTKEQALTPMGAEMGSAKSPFALIKGTNVGTKDDEVRRMMAEMMQDPNYTQIGMDPRKHSQFYDKSTGMPVFSAEEKLQSGPLILAPKKGLETTSWDDPRLNLSDFEGKKYAPGGKVVGGLAELAKKLMPLAEREANKAKFLEGTKVVDYNGKPITMYHHTTDFQGNAFNPKLAQQKDQGYHGQGMYFGGEDYLKRSAFGKHSSGNVYGEEGFQEGSQVMPVNLSIKNPKYVDITEQSLHGMPIEKLKEMGHDGVIVTRDDSFQNVMGRTIPRQKVYNAVAFEPTQVKSAIGNSGTYNPRNPNLTKKKGGKVKKK